ncbi:hypothetical protein BJX96DRAFT_175575 [Aspergillus floccosus]
MTKLVLGLEPPNSEVTVIRAILQDEILSREFKIGARPRLFCVYTINIASDMGMFAAAALKHRSETLGVEILAAADYYNPTWILAKFEEAAGKKIHFVQVGLEI